MKGRPSQSDIREKMTALLDRLQYSYGYEIYKYYKQLFDDATSRVIYYHLRKGCANGEFVSVNVKRVLGNYTWGDETERVYYAIGPFARTKQEWSKKTLSINVKDRSVDYNWIEDIEARINELRNSVKNVSSGPERQKLVNKCDKLIEWTQKKVKEPEKLIKDINDCKLLIK